VEGAVEASQLDGLANGPKCCLDGTGLDLVSLTKITLLDLLSENLKEEELCWLIHILKEWVNHC